MIFLNIAIGIFTASIFFAIIGFIEIARMGGLASGVFALTFVIQALYKRFLTTPKKGE